MSDDDKGKGKSKDGEKLVKYSDLLRAKAMRGGGFTVSQPSSAQGASMTVTPFRFIPVSTVQTSSQAWTTLLGVSPDVAVQHAGDVLLSFNTVIQVTPPLGNTNFQGASVRLVWDGTPLSQAAYFELDPGSITTEFDTFAIPVILRDLVVGASVGNHTLTVEWQTIDVAVLDVFEGCGCLTIEGK